ncbi:MAG: succinylglutamate desuccinylase/aspartoacylase family protein [Sandaracinaceae bacterium]
MIPPLVIGGVTVEAGERTTVELPVARLPTSRDVSMRVHVVRGKRPGPTLFVSAAVHGDEINGVEIVSRLLRMRALSRLRGTLIAVPVVNMFGFLGHSRYLPDRRDLNRAFPGSARGSLGARLAHLFREEVLAKSTHGIDLHTGGLHRTNLPHIRISPDDPVALEMAEHFGALVVLRSPIRAGSLRAAAAKQGVPLIVYEGGEALRSDAWAIKAGLRGVVATMHHLGMLKTRRKPAVRPPPVVADRTRWVRAPAGGMLRARAKLGSRVRAKALLATIGDPHGGDPVPVHAPGHSIVIGHAQLPVVNEGDALFHLLRLDMKPGDEQLEPIEAFQAAIEPRGFEDDD